MEIWILVFRVIPFVVAIGGSLLRIMKYREGDLIYFYDYNNHFLNSIQKH